MKITEDKLSHNHFIHQEINVEHCPSCLDVLPSKVTECPSCKVDLENFKRVALERRMKTLTQGLTHLNSFECQELDQAWRKVEALYIDSEIHHQFLHLCYRMSALSFAVKKYAERLEQDSADETAEVMRKRAVILVHESVQSRSTTAMTPSPASEMQEGFMRLFNYIMAFCLIGGVVILMVSALTQNKLFFFGLGFFLCISSVMTMLFLKREMA